MKLNSPSAQDLLDGYRFYEKQAEGVGTYFLDTLFSEIGSLIVNAGIHPIHFGKHHRLLSRHFPFAVYYRVEGQTTLVHAVLDCRRNPAWTRKKLR